MSLPTDKGLGRRPFLDPRSRAYPVAPLLAGMRGPRSYTWPLDIVLDQGREGACVGFAWAHELRAWPKKVADVDTSLAQHIYREAQKIDPWPGEAYEGTSVLAGIKVAQRLGHYPEYRWAFDLDDLAVAVSRYGPAVLGMDWHEGMYSTRRGRDEKQWVVPAGPVVGGHAIMCRGYNVRLDAFALHNSWGPTWGDKGLAWITRYDLATVLRRQGEMCVPVIR